MGTIGSECAFHPPGAHRLPAFGCTERVCHLVAGAETKIFPMLEEFGIGFVPYCPLGRAFLTGVIDENSRFYEGDRRWNLPQFTPEP